MKPWENRKQQYHELRLGAALTARAFALRLGSAAPLGLNKCVTIINPGLAPWALQEYRPPLGLFNNNNSNKINTTYSFQ